MISPQDQAEVLRLHFSEKLSKRAIAQRLGLHRRSVSAIIQRRSIRTERSLDADKRPSMLAVHSGSIGDLLKQDPSRSAVNILQKLRALGYKGGITILRDYLRACRPQSEPKAYLSLEFLPGQAAQVDWGDFGDPLGLGRKLWCFVMVLCHSRLLYLEFTLSACLESFLRCHERAFLFFGGVPQEMWYDNLATAVSERRQKLIRFNARFLAYAIQRGFKPIACNPASGNEKGRVEDGVRYVRYNFWPGRSWTSFEEINPAAVSWRDTFANKRTHSSTKKIPELVFEQERPCLLGLGEPYDTDQVQSLKASHQFFVSFDGNEYSVPWRLVGRILTVRANDESVCVYLGKNRVAHHPRCWKKNERITNPAHKEGLLETKPAAAASGEIQTLKSLGPYTDKYLSCLGAQNRSIRTELKNLMVLLTVFGSKALEEVIGEALKEGIVGHEHLERLLSRSEDKPPLHSEPLRLADERLKIIPKIPNLESYNGLLFD